MAILSFIVLWLANKNKIAKEKREGIWPKANKMSCRLNNEVWAWFCANALPGSVANRWVGDEIPTTFHGLLVAQIATIQIHEILLLNIRPQVFIVIPNYDCPKTLSMLTKT